MLKFRFILIFVILFFVFLLCRENLVFEKKDKVEVDKYECTIDDHFISFSLPSKYKRLGEGHVPSIYSDVVYVDYRNIRENIFIADTIRENWFLYYVYKGNISNSSEFISACQVQMPFCENIYDFTEEKLDNGYDKFVFVEFHPIKRRNILDIEKKEYGVCIYINCFVKSTDGFCIEFEIQSFEPLAEFNYQEKMDIINSIYVE